MQNNRNLLFYASRNMRIIGDVAIVLIFLNVLNFGDGENRGFCTMEDDCMELEYCEVNNFSAPIWGEPFQACLGYPLKNYTIFL